MVIRCNILRVILKRLLQKLHLQIVFQHLFHSPLADGLSKSVVSNLGDVFQNLCMNDFTLYFTDEVV